MLHTEATYKGRLDNLFYRTIYPKLNIGCLNSKCDKEYTRSINYLIFILIFIAVITVLGTVFVLTLRSIQLLLVLLIPFLLNQTKQLFALHLGQGVVGQQELAVNVVQLVAPVLSTLRHAQVVGNLAPLLLLDDLSQTSKALDGMVQCWKINFNTTDKRMIGRLDGDVLGFKVLGDCCHFFGTPAPPVHQPVDVLIVGREPHVVVHVALGLERTGRNDLANTKGFSLLPDPLDVLHGVLELLLRGPEDRCFNQMCVLAKFWKFLRSLDRSQTRICT